MIASGKLIISYNPPDRKHSETTTVDQFEIYAQNKLAIIQWFIKECKKIETRAHDAYKSHRDPERYKTEVNKVKSTTARYAVEQITLRQNGGCGDFGKKGDQITERLITDLMKVADRMDLPDLYQFLLHPYNYREGGTRHAEQNIMEYYQSIADELKPEQDIPIGCEKLHCFDCQSTEIFFYDTALRFLGRGCNSILFPKVYNFIGDTRTEKHSCSDCANFFKQGKNFLASTKAWPIEPPSGYYNPKQAKQAENFYADDSDSERESVWAKSPTLTPTSPT